MRRFREFLTAAWMWFAMVMACVMTYRILPWITPMMIGSVIGFFAGKHWDVMSGPRYDQ